MEETPSLNVTFICKDHILPGRLTIHVRQPSRSLLLEHDRTHVRISDSLSTYNLPFSTPTTHPSELNRLTWKYG